MPFGGFSLVQSPYRIHIADFLSYIRNDCRNLDPNSMMRRLTRTLPERCGLHLLNEAEYEVKRIPNYCVKSTDSVYSRCSSNSLDKLLEILQA